MRIVVVILSFALGYASAQDSNCDYTQNVQIGQTYYVYSPYYPANYRPGTQCRWIAICPSGYNCRLDCSEIELPQSQGCSMDRLLVSRSGDPQLSGAESYCGRGSLTAVSTAQRLSIGLISASNSPGGRFSCRLNAQLVPPVDPGQCRCGYKKSSRIVGGVETGVNEFPMMAGLAFLDTYQISCGAVIIDKRYVVTAAHCVANQSVNNVAVIVGEHDVTIGTDSPATQGIRAASFIIHPQYSLSTYDYDIAIVVLQQDIVFSERVGPVCLPFKFASTDLTGRYVTMLGWGTQFIGGPTSNVLMKVDVQVISPAVCRAAVTTFLSDRQMCTLTRGKDSCQDDSGGPALYTDPATGLLFNVGIISHGRSCASGYPGISTRVAALLQWITSNTHNNYCRK